MKPASIRAPWHAAEPSLREPSFPLHWGCRMLSLVAPYSKYVICVYAFMHCHECTSLSPLGVPCGTSFVRLLWLCGGKRAADGGFSEEPHTLMGLPAESPGFASGNFTKSVFFPHSSHVKMAFAQTTFKICSIKTESCGESENGYCL